MRNAPARLIISSHSHQYFGPSSPLTVSCDTLTGYRPNKTAQMPMLILVCDVRTGKDMLFALCGPLDQMTFL